MVACQNAVTSCLARYLLWLLDTRYVWGIRDTTVRTYQSTQNDGISQEVNIRLNRTRIIFRIETVTRGRTPIFSIPQHPANDNPFIVSQTPSTPPSAPNPPATPFSSPPLYESRCGCDKSGHTFSHVYTSSPRPSPCHLPTTPHKHD